MYIHNPTWGTTGGAGQVIGGLAVQGGISGIGAITIAHDRDILNLLRTQTGSLVRVPGSWVDFQ